MKKRIITISIFVLLIIIVIFTIIGFTSKEKNDKNELQFVQVKKGDISKIVSSTGTINAQKTVEVGTQVSGTISKIYVDFNDHVKKNQIIAMLDTSLLEISVQSAEADLLKATSQYELAKKDFDNNTVLNENKLLSDFDLDTSRVNKDAAYAAKLSAEANLKKAKANLSYAIIRSPINGTVIERNIEEGQTVAASLSAPTLFSIVEDLSNIQIEALVSESDIGSIKVNQKVNFTVEAYPDVNFTGAVNEIHLKPTVSSNVVNYTVIVYAKNKNNMLLPGMTATLDFIIDEKKDIMMIPNAALKYKPTDAMMKKLSKDAPKFSRNFSQTSKNNNNSEINKNNNKLDNKNKPNKKNIAQLWYLDSNNDLNFIMVETGLTDGQNTEIISDKIKSDMKFIAGYANNSNNKTKSQSNSDFRMRRIF